MVWMQTIVVACTGAGRPHCEFILIKMDIMRIVTSYHVVELACSALA